MSICFLLAGAFSYLDNRQETEVVSLSEDKYAPIAYLRIKTARLGDKERDVGFEVATPALLEAEYSELHSTVEDAVASGYAGTKTAPSLSVAEEETRMKRIGPWIALSNVVAKDLAADASLEEEVTACFHRLQGTARRDI